MTMNDQRKLEKFRLPNFGNTKRHFFIVILLLHTFTLFVAVTGADQEQEIKEGPCMNVHVINNFDFEKFSGRWYEFAGTPVDAGIGTECNQFERHPPNGDRWPISLLYKMNSINYNFTKITTITGPGQGENSDGTKINYVKVNYDRYALVYGCKPMPNNHHKDNVWFLTRKQFPNVLDTMILSSNAIFYGLPIKDIQTKNQTGCPVEWSDVRNISE